MDKKQTNSPWLDCSCRSSLIWACLVCMWFPCLGNLAIKDFEETSTKWSIFLGDMYCILTIFYSNIPIKQWQVWSGKREWRSDPLMTRLRWFFFYNPGSTTVKWARHEKTCLQAFANNTGADQPAHLRSLISTFVIPFLESIICKLATDEISIF